MRKVLLALALLMGVVFSVRAQTTPLATLTGASVSGIAMTPAAELLFVADAAQNLLAVYDISSPDTPQLINEVALDGSPTAVVAGDNYAVVALDIGDDSGLVEIVAPDPFNPGQYAIISFYDTTNPIYSLAISPNQQWGALMSDDWAAVVRIESPQDFIAYPTDDMTSPVDTAFASGLVLMAQSTPPQVLQWTLGRGGTTMQDAVLSLDAQPIALEITLNGSLGAVALDNNEVLFFDPETMEETSSPSISGGAITAMQFVASETGDTLLVSTENSSDIEIVSIESPSSAGVSGSLSVGFVPVHMTIAADVLALSDGQQVSLFQVP
ncbi:MAG: hypothetical protein SF123_09415 [Chloroflexota bacterium]|nr:hypothetical protein [Chloroflexota bacterium]